MHVVVVVVLLIINQKRGMGRVLKPRQERNEEKNQINGMGPVPNAIVTISITKTVSKSVDRPL